MKFKKGQIATHRESGVEVQIKSTQAFINESIRSYIYTAPDFDDVPQVMDIAQFEQRFE